MLVSEMFGPTIQGEGVNFGKNCYFLRLAGCNLHCSFCDSAYTWRFSEKLPHDSNIVYDKNDEVKIFLVDDIIEWIKENCIRHLVITGGEPLLQEHELVVLFNKLADQHIKLDVEIETAGTILPTNIFNYMDLTSPIKRSVTISFNVSPKLANSNNSFEARYKPYILNLLADTNRAIFKFVVSDKNDIEEVKAIVENVVIPNSKVYIMFEGVTVEDQISKMRMYSEEIIKLGWNITTRLHILIWGNKRGV